MTVKAILKKCLEKLNVDDFTEAEQLDETQKNIQKALISALNATYREIVAEYLPFIAAEEVTVKDGKVNASALSKQIIYPVRAERGDVKLDFATDPENIFIEGDGKVTLHYAYIPTMSLEMEDELNLIGVSDSLLTDGTLAQYFLSVGLYDLAKSYDSAYRERLWRLRYVNKSMRMKAGRWAK